MTDVTNKIVVAISGQDLYIDYTEYNLSFESTEQEILTAIESQVQERFNESMRSSDGSWRFKIMKTADSQNIHVIPNLTAGV